MNGQIQRILQEATETIVRLDADRLEEIALSCEELAGESPSHKGTRRNEISIDCRRAERDMGLFKRLLEITNANVIFLHGLSTMRSARPEYARVPVKMCPIAEVKYGNH